ncbi:MAG TPA: hypothetical protein VLV78_04635 [Thermoanaerobaculia bacterium]|nr:hypothetical protein [Thermoanaerobaculia bacterium]
MNMRRTFVLCLSLTLMLAAVARAQTPPYDIEIGYRFLDLSGREDMYRTQINERSGLFIRAFTMSSNEESGALDHYRIDISDLGATPAGSLRLDAGKSGSYRLLVTYRRNDAFTALPTFANPLLSQGIVLGQHTYDRTRNLFDADLTFLPDGKIAPFIGYTFNRYSGPGRTTYTLGQDDYQLFSNLKDKDQEIRGGFTFQTGRFAGVLTQGWRNFDSRESFALIPGTGSGNNPLPILGRPLNAADITRVDHSKVKTPFTNAFATMQATSRVKLIGSFVRFAADSTDNGTEAATGSFVSFPLSRFYTGVNEASDSRAKNTTWRGGLRTEVALFEGVDLLAGWQRENRDITGSALIDTILLQSISFGGATPADFTDVLNAKNALERKEDVFNVAVSARSVGPFSIRAGFAQSKQDITASPDVSEILVPGSQAGTFSRRVNTFDTNVAYAMKSLTVGAAWRRDTANEPILRTDFIDRDRYRLRAAYAAPKWVRFGVTAEETKQNNDRPGTDYNSKLRQYGGDVEVTPMAMLRLRAGASRYNGDTTILFRQPQNFAIGTSVYAEKGKSYEGGIGLTFTKVGLEGDVARYDNTGTTPFTIDRYRARVSYDIREKIGVAMEYSKDKYNESPFLFGDYDANRYGIFLRLRP